MKNESSSLLLMAAKYGNTMCHLAEAVTYAWLLLLTAIKDTNTEMSLAFPFGLGFVLFGFVLILSFFIDTCENKQIILISVFVNVPAAIVLLVTGILAISNLLNGSVRLSKLVMTTSLVFYLMSLLIVYLVSYRQYRRLKIYMDGYVIDTSNQLLEFIAMDICKTYIIICMIVFMYSMTNVLVLVYSLIPVCLIVVIALLGKFVIRPIKVIFTLVALVATLVSIKIDNNTIRLVNFEYSIIVYFCLSVCVICCILRALIYTGVLHEYINKKSNYDLHRVNILLTEMNQEETTLNASRVNITPNRLPRSVSSV